MQTKEYAKCKRLINKIILVKEKGDCCYRCKGKFDYSHYEFHHLDPNEKESHPSNLMSRTLSVVRKEVDKCIVVCASCHQEIHREWEEGKSVSICKEKLSEIIDNGISEYMNGEVVMYSKIIKEMF